MSADRIVAFLGRTEIVENGAYRAIIGEHPDQVYLKVGCVRGGEAMFLTPLDALAIAKALADSAANVIERQFQRQLRKS